jgi:hypothetical protein
MKRCISLVVLAVLVFGTGACNQDARAAPQAGDSQAVGSLQLALTGQDGRMQRYRLRSATFDIQGTRYTDYQSVSTSASSESDIDSASLRVRLFEGAYYVSLRPEDWYLERMTEDGPERVAQAVLLTAQSQYAYITPGATAQVAFQFGVDGELIDFYGGNLQIDIAIENAPDAGATAGNGG